MNYYNEVDFGGPDKLDAYYEDPESEMYQMPELEEMENLENENDNDIENENDSQEDSPRPTKKNPRRSTRPKKKKRKRSSSADSFQECDEGEKVIPLCVTNKEINTGAEYQAVVPDDVLEDDPEQDEDRDELVWQCPEWIQTEKGLEILDAFATEASDRFRIPIDRALYILSKEDYDFTLAMESIEQMKNLRDIWSEDEINNFYNCFFVFGKNFKRIRIAMPHRSLTSIVQYYYDSKKRINYKTFAEYKPPAEIINHPPSSSESSRNNSNSETNPILERYFENMCENCGERCEKMEVVPKGNSHLTKSECRACRLYYEIMDAPRPTSLRLVLSERLKSHYNIPEQMKEFMKDYDELTKKATGITFIKRSMEEEQGVDGICGLSYKYRFQNEIKDEPTDEPMEDSTEETDKQMDLESTMPVASTNDKSHSISPNPVPQIWQQEHTICMEEIEVLADDARRRMFQASVALGRVNKKKISSMKGEMSAIRNRMERMNRDIDLAPSYLSTKVETEPLFDRGWSDKDTKSAMKLFQWYGEKFEYVADILGNKTTAQVKKFYNDNKELLADYMESYQIEMSVRMEVFGLSKELKIADSDDDEKKSK